MDVVGDAGVGGGEAAEGGGANPLTLPDRGAAGDSLLFPKIVSQPLLPLPLLPLLLKALLHEPANRRCAMKVARPRSIAHAKGEEEKRGRERQKK